MRLLRLLHAAASLSRCGACFIGRHAASQEFVFKQSEMRRNFTREFLLHTLVSQESKKLCNNSSPTLHLYDSIVRSFSTNADIFRQRSASSLRARVRSTIRSWVPWRSWIDVLSSLVIQVNPPD